MRNRILIILTLSFLTIYTFAAEENKSTKKKPVQDAPKVQQGYVPKAEITIVEGEDTLVKEYRINGQLRAIKVTPKGGFAPYYLVDKQGTGEFVKIGPDMGEEMTVPNWILIEW